MDDNIPGEEDISEAVLRMRLHFSGGPPGMRAENLRMWLRAAMWEKNSDPENWEKVVAIIQEAFRGGELTAPCDWQMVVIIPNGGVTNFRGIVLVEVLWKAISNIINLRILSSIQFHDSLLAFAQGKEQVTPTSRLSYSSSSSSCGRRSYITYSLTCARPTTP